MIINEALNSVPCAACSIKINEQNFLTEGAAEKLSSDIMKA